MVQRNIINLIKYDTNLGTPIVLYFTMSKLLSNFQMHLSFNVLLKRFHSVKVSYKSNGLGLTAVNGSLWENQHILITKSISKKCVFRIAPTTPGLLNMSVRKMRSYYCLRPEGVPLPALPSDSHKLSGTPGTPTNNHCFKRNVNI